LVGGVGGGGEENKIVSFSSFPVSRSVKLMAANFFSCAILGVHAKYNLHSREIKLILMKILKYEEEEE